MQRIFTLPVSINSAEREQLRSSLAGLQSRQTEWSRQDSRLVAASQIDLLEDGLVLNYDLTCRTSLGLMSLGERPAAEQLLHWAVELAEVFTRLYPPGLTPQARHGSLSGGNVVLDEQGHLRILDLGVAELIQPLIPADNASLIEQFASWVAPERWNDPRRIDEGVDLFAVAVLLYELACGKHPFGAIRDDAEDCRYQILVEVPVPPHKKLPGVPVELSNIIYKGLRSERELRYASFQEMLTALQNCRLEAAETPAAPQRPAATIETHSTPTPAASATTSEEAARQQYLQEQLRLREEREATERRQAQVEQQLQAARARWTAWWRRHAVAASLGLLLLAGAITSGVIQWQRSRQDQWVRRELARLTEALNESWQKQSGKAWLQAWSATGDDAQLDRLLTGLQRVSGQQRFAVNDIAYSDFWRRTGQAVVRFGDPLQTIRFTRSQQTTQLQFTEPPAEQWPAILSARIDQLALAQLSPAVIELMGRVRQTFNQATSGAAARQAVAALLTGSDTPTPINTLGYLGFQAQRKKIELGPFKPLPGETAVSTEVRVSDTNGKLINDLPWAMIWRYECAEAGACRLLRVELNPADEPLEHREWCMQQTLADIRTAFLAHDEVRLTDLLGQGSTTSLPTTLAWVQQCRSAELQYGPLNTGSGSLTATIAYQPGILNEQEYTIGALPLELAPETEWGVRQGLTLDWPTAPAPLLRQQQGQQLLQRLQASWNAAQAADYLQLFPGTARRSDEIEAMLARFQQEKISINWQLREDAEMADRLIVELIPQGVTSEVATRYGVKRLGFMVRGTTLEWDRTSDPLWLVQGLAYQNWVQRLTNLSWSSAGELTVEFRAQAGRDLNNEERTTLIQWFDAVDQISNRFEPLEEERLAGWPRRLRLTGSAMTFRLIKPLSDSDPLLYVQEQEVTVADVLKYWRRADRPWELWKELVGATPQEQVVGLSYDEALALAQQFGGRLPTRAEWLRAAAAVDETTEQPGSAHFFGGVWEFCQPDPADSTPLIMGGCWYDLEGPRVIAPTSRAIQRQLKYGTIGFRWCQPVTLPPAAIALIREKMEK
ncbi:MAG: hypothetical protein HJJLKODD_00885 [Phycisphaerae bacterium]|nr:hypothetical protein [Phycisphaerae bacterium]